MIDLPSREKSNPTEVWRVVHSDTAMELRCGVCGQVIRRGFFAVGVISGQGTHFLCQEQGVTCCDTEWKTPFFLNSFNVAHATMIEHIRKKEENPESHHIKTLDVSDIEEVVQESLYGH